MKPLFVALLTAGLPHSLMAQAVDTTFDSNGVPIRYVTSGAGEPIVLIHGFSETAETWDPVRADLSGRYWVIAMDCRGHGRSGKPHDPRAYGIETPGTPVPSPERRAMMRRMAGIPQQV